MTCTIDNRFEIARLQKGFWGRQELVLTIPTPADQHRVTGWNGVLAWDVADLDDIEAAAGELIAAGERWVCLRFGQVTLKRWENA